MASVLAKHNAHFCVAQLAVLILPLNTGAVLPYITECYKLRQDLCLTSFPFVSPFSIHSTVTLSLSSFKDVTMA